MDDIVNAANFAYCFTIKAHSISMNYVLNTERVLVFYIKPLRVLNPQKLASQCKLCNVG